MTDLPTDRIRNVVLVGHNGAGTTTLAEALLAEARAIARPGAVDAGTSMLDTEPESVKRRMSLSLAMAPFDWTATDGRTYRVNLIDTPGYADFVGEVFAAMSVADLAVFVVSAVDGVGVQTELLWRRAAALGLPRMVFVSKEDRERADFHAVLGQLTATLGTGFVPLELPLGEAGTLHGVADVLSEEAVEYGRGGGRHRAALPDDVADEEHRAHDALVEEIVSGDDVELERYLGGEVLTVDELERTLRHEVLECREFPVLLGSATTGVGIDRLADYVCELGPSPADRAMTVRAGEADVPVTADASGDPLVFVFKTVVDPFVGQLSLFKVLSGTVRVGDHLVNARSGADERLHGLVLVRGKQQVAVSELTAGDIGAVAKLSDTRTFDTLTRRGMRARVAPPTMPVPRYGVAISPRTQADDDKLGGALARLQAEDPVLCVDRDAQTHQTVLHGMGDAHVAVALERLARTFGVIVDTEPVRVPYRETIAAGVTVQGKVKKQSGGHGQFAVADMRITPLPRGAGFQFVDSVAGGAIPRSMIPAVQRGIEDALAAGGLHGLPVVDLQVECFDGKYHPVDSSEMAFRTAASVGLREALASAGVLVLEPISTVRVTVPGTHQGDVMGDVSSRRGRVMGTEQADAGWCTVLAQVPTSELVRYAVELRSMTGGRGDFAVEHDHYDVLPDHLVGRVTAADDR